MLTKKTLLLLLSIMISLHAMKKELTNDDLLKACQTQATFYIQYMLQAHPNLNINYCNEHGTTPLLSAAGMQTSNSWVTAQNLLAMKNINYLHKDKYGQSLFSKAIYSGGGLFRLDFRTILTHYTLEQVNNECKSLSYDRNNNLKLRIPFYEDKEFIKDLSEELPPSFLAQDIRLPRVQKAIEKRQRFIESCKQRHHIPLIKKLLIEGTSLNKRNIFLNSAVDENELDKRTLYENLSDKTIFALREIFNYGPHYKNDALLKELFTNTHKSKILYPNQDIQPEEQTNIPDDIINLIKIHIGWIIKYQNIEKSLWIKALGHKIEDTKVQQYSTIKEKDYFKFRRALLQLSQQEKTKLNIKVCIDMYCEPCKR
jgi:hypothetical protein